ncbi:class IV adenylate cyclase [Aureliella helgolandensis]|uniref:CYTH domain protein n=1 Tax=Aureliella helgolandensis TaxID=2527968 RepID=A0A518GG40_9BACT|nr:class IV adenylate cyclase [Aureliella helgolandensis]QDV27564.1 CYTH domain protein [Aureliella helgolandensis]
MTQTWEVEQKFEVSDVAAVLAAIERVGLQEYATEQHVDTYFRHPCRDFRQTDEAFRLRLVNDQACATYKGPRLPGKVKSRPEIELAIDSSEQSQWRAMLERLGFQALPEVRKTRRIFSLPKQQATIESPQIDWQGVVVAVDDVEQLGHFAEVELLVTDQEHIAASRDRIAARAIEIGLCNVQPRSYLSQLLSVLGEES